MERQFVLNQLIQKLILMVNFLHVLVRPGPVHVGVTHPLVPMPNIITVPMQTKITFNGIPFAVYGAICSCGDIVCGSLANPKVIIQ